MRLLLKQPHRFFLICSVVFCLLYIALTPPFEAPDEASHFLRVYELSQGSLLQKTASVPVSMVNFIAAFCNRQVTYPSVHSLTDFSTYFSYLRPWEKSPLDAHNVMQIPAARASYYSPLPYLAALPFVRIGSALNLSPLLLLYISRICLCAAATWMLYCAIRITPYFKWQLTLLGLFPATLFVRCGVTADSLTLGYIALFFAFVLQAYERQRHLSKKDVTLLSLLAAAICLSKTYYALWIFLPLLLLRECLPATSQRIRAGIAIIFLPLALGAAWIMLGYFVLTHAMHSTTMLSPDSVDATLNQKLGFLYATTHVVNAPEQLALLLHQPWRIVAVPLMTLIAGLPGLIKDIVTTLGIPPWHPGILGWPWRWVMFLALFLLPATEGNERPAVTFAPAARWALAGYVIATYSVMCLSLYIVWTPLGLPVTFGLQGRYITPMLPALWIAFHPTWLKLSPSRLKILHGMLIALLLFMLACGALELVRNNYHLSII